MNSALIIKLKQQSLLDESYQGIEESSPTSWYIKVVMGLFGWLAGTFLLLFLGMGLVGLFEHRIAQFLVGFILLGCAWLLSKANGVSEFLEQLALTASVAGQLLLGLALFGVTDANMLLAWLGFLAIQCGIAAFMPFFTHRFIAAFLASVSLAMVLNELQLASFYSAIVLLLVSLLWLNEFTLTHNLGQIRAIGYGATLGLIQFKTSVLFSSHGRTWDVEQMPQVHPWLDEGLNILVLVYVVWHLFKHGKLHLTQQQITITTGLLALLCLATFFANGIAVGLTLILLGFAHSHRMLLILGLICSLVNLSSYYYLLEMSLLNKSLVLMLLGMFALGMLFIQRYMTGKEEKA